MLGYLDTRRSDWPAQLRTKRQLYDQFIDEMIIPPGSAAAAAAAEAAEDCATTVASHTNGASADHPLSDGPDSAWGTYFKDNEVLLQIDHDVRRLCPDMSFFQQPTEHPCRAIVDGDGRRLHSRVQPSVLNSANVERKGLGLTKVYRCYDVHFSHDFITHFHRTYFCVYA